MIKYFNFILLSFLILLFFGFETSNKISTNLHSILPDSENKELLESFLKFDSNKKILLAVKDTSKESLKKLKEIEEKLLTIEGLSKKHFMQNGQLLEFKQQYQLYLGKIDKEKLLSLDVQKELKNLYKKIYNSFFIAQIDENDPFGLIKKDTKQIALKKGRLLLKDYGFLAIYTIDSKINSLEQYERIYNSIKKIEKSYTDIKSFSIIYYFVENSRYIKNDGKILAFIGIALLLILYLVVLKNIPLLLNTLLALSSSALLATIITTTIYPTISIFVLVFGFSVSTIAVDYMFHHYFHKKYARYSGFNKEVFLGFFTTFGAFFILSFIDFLLIKQVAVFAMISLASSYIIFSFIFPFVQFKQSNFRMRFRGFSLLKDRTIFAVSIFILTICYFNLNFDFNIKNLNYDNKSLKQIEHFFKDKLSQNNPHFVIIKAKTINELILNSEKLKQLDENLQTPLNNLISKEKFLEKKRELKYFDKIKNDLSQYSKSSGFKDKSFIDAYRYDLSAPTYSYGELLKYGISIQKYKNYYISFATLSANKLKEALRFDFIHSASLKTMFETYLQKELKSLVALGIMSLTFIFIVIALIGRKKLLSTINFLLFPSAIIFLYFSFVQINILHIFMFFIVLAICIDYGIYLSKNNNSQTKKAIVFSALSSFAGFGVLVFSATNSLHSIGIVATLGIIAILVLIFLKESSVS